MIIHQFAPLVLCASGESMEVQLPRKGLKLDPRASLPNYVRFSIDYHDDGITATLTRLDNDGYDGWYDDDSFSMRAFDPQTETVPDFNSTIYVNMGLPGEYAPSDTTLVIIHPSVKIIQEYAFRNCKKLRRVVMHENVETIERWAFSRCLSLDAVFLPSSIKMIGHNAFYKCPNLRILSIPQTIDTESIGYKIINYCDTLFRITQLPIHDTEINNQQVNQAMIDFNRNLPPLHKVCLHTNVSAQSIRQCIDTHGTAAAYNANYGYNKMTYIMYIQTKFNQWSRYSRFSFWFPRLPKYSTLDNHALPNESKKMKPMHILALNPHADTGAILTLFHGNMGAMFEPYKGGCDGSWYPSAINGKTPLEYLGEYNKDAYLSIVEALCMHRGGQQN